MPDAGTPIEDLFPLCRALLGEGRWPLFTEALRGADPETAPETFAHRFAATGLPGWTPELALLEWTRRRAAEADVTFPETVDEAVVNPTLQLLHCGWRLMPLLDAETLEPPENGEQWIVVRRHPKTGALLTDAADDADLLALKVVVDGLSPDEAAAAGNGPAHAVYDAISRAAERGLLLEPPSALRRDTSVFPRGRETDEEFVAVGAFVIQWHITHACDLHCRHCYDRSARSDLTLDQAVTILDDLRRFCDARHVGGHVCVSGGNPLLHPHVVDIWRAAAERGFALSMLGNAASREAVEPLIGIEHPTYYQVSLEGLREHNDAIRGEGYFDRVMVFLDVLRELEVESTVMLTLTRDNIDQVLPLAELLRDRTDCFTFNRLSPVGEGARLQLPGRERYEAFLAEYVEAADGNPIMGFKDNLINIELARRGRPPFDGCSGFGCGTAFNFICLLPDGEAHACRKFPSPIGNVLTDGIAGVYDSEAAKRYRAGSAACAGCALRPHCGGCLAITDGHGLDLNRDRDPFCFYPHAPERAQKSRDSHLFSGTK